MLKVSPPPAVVLVSELVNHFKMRKARDTKPSDNALAKVSEAELRSMLERVLGAGLLTTEEMALLAPAASSDPQVVALIKILLTRESVRWERDLLERRLSESKQHRDEMRALSETFLKAQQDLFQKAMESLQKVEEARGATQLGNKGDKELQS